MNEPTENQEKSQSLEEIKALLNSERQARALAETELAKRETALNEITNVSTETKKTLNDTVTAYKMLVVKANPAIPVELISGDSVKTIDSSLEAAKNLVAKVRTTIEADIAAGRVPAGAPPRTSPDVENLTPREKIQIGVTRGTGK